MGEEQVDVYDAVGPAANFFQAVGDAWFSGAGGDATTPGSRAILFGEEQSPLGAKILQEVKTGWSVETVLDFWGWIFPLSIFFALVAGTSVTYCAVRIYQVRRLEHAIMRAGAKPIVAQDTPRVQLRWRTILEQVSSDEPQKWRTAVLEADQLLNELLDTLGYKGETMADKMRKISITAFNTIDFAWEAHQIRNRIAHDESFTLDAREAKRVIKLYERVFKEFKFIPNE